MAFSSSVMETPALPESLRSSASAAAAPAQPPPPPPGGDRHLTAQLDLNTSLLERLHAAETRKLQDHAATAGREALLAETRELLNSLNDENAELREELARASEQLRTMGRELGSTRTDREEAETSLKQLNYNLLYQLQEKNALLEAAQNTAAEKERRAAEAQSAVEAVSAQLYEAAKERDALQREHDTVCCTMRAVEEQCGEALAKYARLLPEGGRERALTREGSVDQRLEAVMGALAEKVLALEEAASREAQRGAQGETQAATLRSRLHAMDAACLDLRRQLEAKSREAAEATAEMQRQLDGAREAGHSLALDVVRCRQDFVGSLEESERRAEVVRAEYRTMLAEMVQVEAACDRGALQLAAQQSELAALRAAEAEGARTTLQALRQASGQAQTQAEQRQALREEAEQLRKRLRAERQRREEGDESLAQVRQHRDQAKQEAALLHAALKQLKEENGGLEATVRRLQREHQGADSRGEQLQRQAVGLAEDLEEERRAHGRLREECRVHEARLGELEEENRKLSEATRSDVGALDKMLAQLKKAEEVNSVLSEQRDLLQEENTRLRKSQDDQLKRVTAKTSRALHSSPYNSPARPVSASGGSHHSAGPSSVVYSAAAAATTTTTTTTGRGPLTGQVMTRAPPSRPSQALSSMPSLSVSLPSARGASPPSPSPEAARVPTAAHQAQPTPTQHRHSHQAAPASPPFAADAQQPHQRPPPSGSPERVGVQTPAAAHVAAGAAQAHRTTQQQHFSATRGATAASASAAAAAAPTATATPGDDEAEKRAYNQRLQGLKELDEFTVAQQALEARFFATLKDLQDE
eukprot:Rhum_TRINITY_DN10992_c0_g1::Rhum_TRINITY_DN10992_c0_g1_i1::g.41119::m.41119